MSMSMSSTMHGTWAHAMLSFPCGKGRIARLLAGLAIVAASLAGIYVAAAWLAAALAATIRVAEPASRSNADASAPATSSSSVPHDISAVAERNSLGLRSVRWQTDGPAASL